MKIPAIYPNADGYGRTPIRSIASIIRKESRKAKVPGVDSSRPARGALSLSKEVTDIMKQTKLDKVSWGE